MNHAPELCSSSCRDSNHTIDLNAESIPPDMEQTAISQDQFSNTTQSERLMGSPGNPILLASPTAAARRSCSLNGRNRSTVSRGARSWSISDGHLELQSFSSWSPGDDILQTQPSAEPSSSITPQESSSDVSAPTTVEESSPYVVLAESLLNKEKNEQPWVELCAMDLSRIQRAQLYNYYISRLDKLQVLCDKARVMTDFPAHAKDDFELLRAVTYTHGSRRWWTILIDDLACPDCVAQLRAKREKPRSMSRRLWLATKGRVKGICKCADNRHDFQCTHTGKDMNKVTRFFHILGKSNATRMVNIELDTKRWALVDPEILASAVYNISVYFPNVHMLSVKFHFCEGVAVASDHMARIVCSLAQLEALLPWQGRLMVQGFERNEALQIAWAKKSRKWWQ